MARFDPCSVRYRWTLVAVAVLLACPLVVAGLLTPAASGIGTHQQLGFPPCTFRVFFGLRCPACGMTTSWAHLVRGDVGASIVANPGGTLLGIITATSALVLIVHGFAARRLANGWFAALAAGLTLAMTLATIDWFWRVAT